MAEGKWAMWREQLFQEECSPQIEEKDKREETKVKRTVTSFVKLQRFSWTQPDKKKSLGHNLAGDMRIKWTGRTKGGGKKKKKREDVVPGGSRLLH